MRPDHTMTAVNGTAEAKSESLRQSLSLPSVPDISPQVRRIRVRPHRRLGLPWVLKVSHHIYPNVPPRFTPPLPDAALRRWCGQATGVGPKETLYGNLGR